MEAMDAVGDVVWAKELHLSKAAEGFAAKLESTTMVITRF